MCKILPARKIPLTVNWPVSLSRVYNQIELLHEKVTAAQEERESLLFGIGFVVREILGNPRHVTNFEYMLETGSFEKASFFLSKRRLLTQS